MDSSDIKELMFGGIKQIMSQNEYYYNSSVSPDYSRFTDKGKEVLLEFVNMVGHKLLIVEEQELNDRAKKLVINGLKGEKV